MPKVAFATLVSTILLMAATCGGLRIPISSESFRHPHTSLFFEREHTSFVRKERISKERVIKLEGPETFFEFLSSSPAPAVIVFHASWCKACQRFGQNFDRLARRDLLSDARYASVEYGANSKLCKALGVKQLPKCHIYVQGELVFDEAVGPKRFHVLEEAVKKVTK